MNMTRDEVINELQDLSLSIGNDEDEYDWSEFADDELIMAYKDNFQMDVIIK